MSDKITDEMIEAGCKAYLASKKNADVPATFRAIYTAMSQAHPTDEEEVERLKAEVRSYRFKLECANQLCDRYKERLAALNAIRGGE